jgi:L-cysteine desulfidase
MGKVGISTIAAAGFVTKNSVMKLSVLSKITNQQVIKAKKIAKKIDVQIAKNCNPVYVKVLATDKLGNVCDVLIEEEHDYIKQVKFNNKLVNIDGKIINNSQQHIQYNVNEITLNDIYHNIDLMNENDLMPLNKSIEMNRALVEYAKKNNCKFINISKKHDT